MSRKIWAARRVSRRRLNEISIKSEKNLHLALMTNQNLSRCRVLASIIVNSSTRGMFRKNQVLVIFWMMINDEEEL